jgi:hypothetical protein
VAATDAVTLIAADFLSTTPISGGFSFNDGFGTGTVTSSSNTITVDYRPGDAPAVSLPPDWPASLVPNAGSTSAAFRATLAALDLNGSLTVAFILDRVLSASDLSAVAAASTAGLSPQMTTDGGIAL